MWDPLLLNNRHIWHKKWNIITIDTKNEIYSNCAKSLIIVHKSNDTQQGKKRFCNGTFFIKWCVSYVNKPQKDSFKTKQINHF